MPRIPRHFVPGYPSHLVHRGNNRQVIFHCEGDYHYFWRCLKDATDKFQVSVNSYVFMANHVHVLLTPKSSGAISQAMHSASRRYSGYFNTRYRRTGTLWEGRFFASLVTADHYLFACHRYIDLNPVRASLVRSPELYPWSSHRYYAMGERNPLVTAHHTITSLATPERSLTLAYRAMFEHALDPSDMAAIREASIAGRAIGADKTPMGRPRKKVVPDTTY
jgi:putative transposase